MSDKIGLHYVWSTWLLAFIGAVTIVLLVVSFVFFRNEVKLSWRNILRNKRRSSLTLLAVAFAFAGNVLLGIYFLQMFDGLRESTIRSQTGHLQILKDGFLEYGSSAPTEYLIPQYQEILDAINNDARIKDRLEAAMKEVRFQGIVSSTYSGRSINFLGRGVDLEQDAILSGYDTYIVGGPLKTDDRYSIVLGEGLAKQLKVDKDEDITLLSTLFDGGINVLDATVGGVLRSFSREYSNVIVKTSLEYAQEMIGTDSVNKLIFLLDDTRATSSMKQVLLDIVGAHPEWGVQVYDWLELEEFYVQVHTMFSTIYIIVSTMLFCLIIFLVLNTMTMSIFERFNEFGTLRSIGVTQTRLIMLVIYEGILLGLIGTIAGYFIAWGMGDLISSAGLTVPAPPGQTTGYPLNLRYSFNLSGFVQLIVISLLSITGITVLSSVFPAIKAARLKIIDALHSI